MNKIMTVLLGLLLVLVAMIFIEVRGLNQVHVCEQTVIETVVDVDVNANYLFLRELHYMRIYFPQWIEIGTGDGRAIRWIESVLRPMSIRIYTFDITSRTLATDRLGNDQPIDPLNPVKYEVTDENIEHAVQQWIRDHPAETAIFINPLSSITISLEELLYENLKDIAEHSIIIVERALLTDQLVPSSLYRVDTELDALSLSLGSTLTALVRTDESKSEHIAKRRAELGEEATRILDMLPAGVSWKSANFDTTTRAFDRLSDWLLVVRIQKVASASILRIIRDAVGMSNRCAFATLITSNFDQMQCTAQFPCSQTFGLNKIDPNCRSVDDHYCDMTDFTLGWDIANDPHARAVTWLRDPVERVVSEWVHVGPLNKQKGWDYCLPSWRNVNTTRAEFVAFLSNPSYAFGMHNRQTRMLSGCGSLHRCSNVFGTDEQAGARMLHLAKYNLMKMEVVGVLEHFGESLLLLNHRFGFNVQEYRIVRPEPLPPAIPFRIDEGLRGLVARYNQLDVELYEFAKELHRYRIAQYKHFQNLLTLPTFNCTEGLCSMVFDY